MTNVLLLAAMIALCLCDAGLWVVFVGLLLLLAQPQRRNRSVRPAKPTAPPKGSAPTPPPTSSQDTLTA